MFRPLADIFANADEIDRMSVERGEAPAVRACDSQGDLARWLLRFGDACKAAMPKSLEN
jgi:hypothetical protein